ncbi:hypothetical protein QQ045_002521 [Rhodiola kirilowii]
MESLSVVSESTLLLEDSYAYGVVEHPFPLNCCLTRWYLGPDFYHAVKIGTVQYMIVKSICALLSLILQSFGVYGEGKFEWGYGILALEQKSKIQDYIICIEMCIAAVAHLYVFSALPYKRGERCVRNVAVMNDYACLGSPPDRKCEIVKDTPGYTRLNISSVCVSLMR